MRRVFLVAFGFALIVGSAAAAPTGGRLANYLYATSLYGIAHPLPATALTPYSLSPSQKRREASEASTGVVGNILFPGFGSMLIGDPHGPWIAVGFFSSLGLSLVTFAVFILGALSDGPPPYDPTPFGIAALASGGVAAGFYIWGIFSPINYVHRHYHSVKG